MSARVGQLDWAMATRGRLSARDRLELVRQAAVAQFEDVFRRGPRGHARLDLDGLSVPDSALAKHAEEACSELSSEALRNHSHRCFLFGTAFGTAEKVAHDPELLYVACMLHDLGLDPPRRPADGSCFTLVGAERALELEARRAAEAIAIHMNLRVTLDDGAEGYLLTAGAQLDVIGRRYREVDRATVDGVVARHPRAAMKREFADLTVAHGRSAPGTRAAMYSRLGLRFMMRRAPWGE